MKKKHNRGQVLVLVALAIIVLLAFAALAIDLGYLWTVRHELQRSADAGALAGASAFKDPPYKGSDNPGTKNKARNRAKEFATKDKVITSVLDPNNEVTVTFNGEHPDITNNFQIRVETSRTAGLIFGRIFRPTALVTASAIAEAATASNNVNCIKPWGVSYPWNDNNPKNDLYDQGQETVYEDCDPSNPDWSFCPGSLLTMKVSNKDNTAIPPTPNPQTETSHFFALDFVKLGRDNGCPGKGGAAGYEDWVTSKCLDECVAVSTGDSIPVEPGNMVGPTYDGAQALINQEAELGGVTRFDEQIARECGHPIFGSENCDGTTWKLSPRVFRIPVYDPRIDQLSPGNADIHVAEFAGMWLDHVDNQGGPEGQATVYGRWINKDVLSGAGGGSPTGTPKLLYLRLVK